MSGQGPWGGGGRNDDDRGVPPDGNRPPEGRRPPPRRPGAVQPPGLDDLLAKGREQFRVLTGGRGPGAGSGRGGPPAPPQITRSTLGLGALAAVGLWLFMSFYTVRPEEQSVELFLGEFSDIGEPGLNFAPWPLVTYQVENVSSERTEAIGASNAATGGLMLTTDANVVNIGFQVVWNVRELDKYLFNVADAEDTVRAVSESVMREIIATTTFSSILNRDRGVIADTAIQQIQAALDAYDSGINIIRVNFERAEPPEQVIDAFLDVQAAEQFRDQVQREADGYANRVTAEARGEAAQLIEQAEAYRAQTVNDALGQSSRFSAVLDAYRNAEDVTRERIYIETMESVMGDVGKIILDPSVSGSEGGQGVVPFLPLDQIMRQPTPPASGAAASTAVGN